VRLEDLADEPWILMASNAIPAAAGELQPRLIHSYDMVAHRARIPARNIPDGGGRACLPSNWCGCLKIGQVAS
jgi:hypothetical protein